MSGEVDAMRNKYVTGPQDISKPLEKQISCHKCNEVNGGRHTVLRIPFKVMMWLVSFPILNAEQIQFLKNASACWHMIAPR